MVVYEAFHSLAGGGYVATFANILVYSIVGGTVSYALIRLTTQLGGGVIAFVERLFS